MMCSQKTNTEVNAYETRTIWLQAALVAAFCGCTKEVLCLLRRRKAALSWADAWRYDDTF